MKAAMRKLQLLGKPIENFSADDWAVAAGELGYPNVSLGVSMVKRLFDIAEKHNVYTLNQAMANERAAEEISEVWSQIQDLLDKKMPEQDTPYLIHNCPNCGCILIIEGVIHAEKSRRHSLG